MLKNIEKYEKSGVPPHRQMSLDSYVRALNYDPVAADAEAIRQMRERELELERKRQAERETSQKFEDVKKNVKQEADARQTNLKKKRKDELEFGSI